MGSPRTPNTLVSRLVLCEHASYLDWKNIYILDNQNIEILPYLMS